MRALILAAGRGKRLAESHALPKCLLEFEGRSLLERHLLILTQLGVQDIAIAIGYQAEQVEQALDTVAFLPRPQTVYNADFNKGSVVSLWTLREQLRAGGEILLMDADVLYDYRLGQRLLQSPHSNCFLLDRHLDPGEEPVKLCLRDGVLVEFRKQLPPGLRYDIIGESVGFFRFSEKVAGRLAALCQDYMEQSHQEAPHEEAIRDLLLETPERFGIEDITGLPWIEIDFPEDIRQAENIILPQLEPLKSPPLL
ncbi:NTP transferase domain-containing protein [Nitrosococcus wardiae]|uniref:Phosphocholine cytidylyltransferase family protein n=1 Tax=Nitrosococcus wardiae TaxID=1814290 RepID=A0A4P7C0B2_9GAMM|nr:phosphocholine cytidylyltransferase family protein [Nitrosococcus wardiae]QBQ55988.1 phosphocholine cytidylyltransferase family protein [Nitrosococcus wardiae]